MFKYTIKRLLQSVVTVLIVVTIVFLLMRMLPTDYFFTEDQLMKFYTRAERRAVTGSRTVRSDAETTRSLLWAASEIRFWRIQKNSERC